MVLDNVICHNNEYFTPTEKSKSTSVAFAKTMSHWRSLTDAEALRFVPSYTFSRNLGDLHTEQTRYRRVYPSPTQVEGLDHYGPKGYRPEAESDGISVRQCQRIGSVASGQAFYAVLMAEPTDRGGWSCLSSGLHKELPRSFVDRSNVDCKLLEWPGMIGPSEPQVLEGPFSRHEDGKGIFFLPQSEDKS